MPLTQNSAYATGWTLFKIIFCLDGGVEIESFKPMESFIESLVCVKVIYSSKIIKDSLRKNVTWKNNLK